ncbi:MAG: recombination mediator RecR [Coriobacteriia bacterium]|nr:recombination mediator RecR [Coriobacteriia bacterium]
MPQSQPSLIQKLLDEFERLPGIGPKSAQRIVYWLLNNEASNSERLAVAITEVRQSVHFCSRCFNYAESELCPICADLTRDNSMLAVVSEPRDIVAIEKTATFRGLYHVLGGALSPMDGIGADQLNVAPLMARLADTAISEVIFATNPNVEGETTAGYLARLIKPFGIKTTRLASGLPVGGDLEFADEVTLGRAIEDRHEM